MFMKQLARNRVFAVFTFCGFTLAVQCVVIRLTQCTNPFTLIFVIFTSYIGGHDLPSDKVIMSNTDICTSVGWTDIAVDFKMISNAIVAEYMTIATRNLYAFT
eukprot:377784_1